MALDYEKLKAYRPQESEQQGEQVSTPEQKAELLLRLFGHLSEAEIHKAWAVYSRDTARKAKRRATGLKGPEAARRKEEVLTAAVLGVARRARDPKEYWWSGKLRHRQACEYVAANLPQEARDLFHKPRVSWKAVARYTKALKGLRHEDDLAARRRAEAGGGLLAGL